ncbi:Hypothetical predicted protein [Mytilus galloprovincialis]|uniref:Uncharacterized protein n=1 Tax=Mytilus galloprovincialis TaxID=29158 RepID=A0A8B6EYA9_MYTGA|nr:Hypothetical predicted protein [Mytilus galloprovincialis]
MNLLQILNRLRTSERTQNASLQDSLKPADMIKGIRRPLIQEQKESEIQKESGMKQQEFQEKLITILINESTKGTEQSPPYRIVYDSREKKVVEQTSGQICSENFCRFQTNNCGCQGCCVGKLGLKFGRCERRSPPVSSCFCYRNDPDGAAAAESSEN